MFNPEIHLLVVTEKLRIMIAGDQSSGYVSSMIIHVLRTNSVTFSYESSFSDPDNCVCDILIINTLPEKDLTLPGNFEESFQMAARLAANIRKGGKIMYYESDDSAKQIVYKLPPAIIRIPFRMHGHFQNKAGFFAATHNRTVPLKPLSEDQMVSLSAAREACLAAGVDEDDFYNAMMKYQLPGLFSTFKK